MTQAEHHESDHSELTAERLVGSPSLDGPSLTGVKVSPDGARITFLKGKESDFRQQDLWEYHIADGEQRLLVDSDVLLGGAAEQLSEEEKARRERQRIRGSGIVAYYWNEDGTALLCPLNGDLYYYGIAQGQPRKLTDSPEFETDVRFSPKGNYVSFIRERDLYIVHVQSGKETRLTSGANDVIAHGVAEFIAQEELDRDTGYWWAPDESRIAFTRIDESPVDVLNRYELNPDGTVTTREQRYPAAGTANAVIQLGVVTVDQPAITWIDLGDDTDIYLARVNWLADSSGLIFQRLPRDQESIDLVKVDADGSHAVTIVHEETDVWINLTHNLKTLKESDDWLWTSERSGFRHIYRFGSDGKLQGALTTGDWVVDSIVQVDEESGWVYFEGFKDNTFEKHLYRAKLDPDPKSVERITREEGWHEVTMGKGEIFLDRFSAPKTPPQLAVRDKNSGELVEYVVENALVEGHPYYPYIQTHAPSQFGQLPAADGTTMLDYQMILPSGFDPTNKYPAILAPYGGPHGHSVRKDWSVDSNQLLARNGFVILIVDNRGMYNRGVAFEAPIKNAMGTVEVEDQLAAARWLQEKDFVDAERIGFHGWSYGGYMTLMMLFKAPDIFKVGVAGAPVTDWRLYDTGYTERYLGMPQAPGDVYENSSVFKYADGLKGKLLLIHGMADDNVFFDNSVKLMGVLQQAGVQFDLMTYPGQKHGFRTEPIQKHVAELRLKYFKEHL